jgi:hypothetical protein
VILPNLVATSRQRLRWRFATGLGERDGRAQRGRAAGLCGIDEHLSCGPDEPQVEVVGASDTAHHRLAHLPRGGIEQNERMRQVEARSEVNSRTGDRGHGVTRGVASDVPCWKRGEVVNDGTRP